MSFNKRVRAASNGRFNSVRPIREVDEETALLSGSASSEEEDTDERHDAVRPMNSIRARRLSRRASNLSIHSVVPAPHIANTTKRAENAEIKPGFTFDFICMMACLLTCIFMSSFDSTVVSSTYTVISSSMNAANLGSWLSTSYLLTSTSIGPLYAKVSDSTGRRPPYLVGIFLYMLGSLCCGFAPTMPALIAARALGGIGSGGMMGMGMVLMSDVIPVRQRGLFQAINNFAFGGGGVLGASIGGLLADTIGWRYAFLGQIPFGICAFSLVLWRIPNLSRPKESLRSKLSTFDFKGSALLTSSVFLLLLGFNIGGNILPWSHPLVIAVLVVGFLMVVLLVFEEKGAKSPILPLQLLSTSPRANLIFSNFFVAMTNYGLIFNLPIFFQAVLMESATVAGARLAIPSLAGFFAAVFGGVINSRYTHLMKFFMVFGVISNIIGGILVSQLRYTSPEWMFSAYLVPANMGQGLMFPTATLAMLVMSTRKEFATTTATQSLFRSLGGVMGVASSSAILQNGLSYYLNRAIDDPELRELVRESVAIVKTLPPGLREVVRDCYQNALSWVFGSCICFSTIAMGLVVFTHIPNLE